MNEPLLSGRAEKGIAIHDGEAEPIPDDRGFRSEEHTSELQSRGHLVCRLLLEKKTHSAASVAQLATTALPRPPSAQVASRERFLPATYNRPANRTTCQ